jgi:hypothetical protein
MASEVRWVITRQRGDAYLITNAGREPAYRVVVTTRYMAGTGAHVGAAQISQEIVRGGEAVEFLAVLTAEEPDRLVRVTWFDDEVGGVSREWRHPVPW